MPVQPPDVHAAYYDLVVRIDERVEQMRKAMADHETAHQAMETRLRSVERWQWRSSGIAAAAAVVGSAIVAPLVRLVLTQIGG